jgi:hypothetical protein
VWEQELLRQEQEQYVKEREDGDLEIICACSNEQRTLFRQEIMTSIVLMLRMTLS